MPRYAAWLVALTIAAMGGCRSSPLQDGDKPPSDAGARDTLADAGVEAAPSTDTNPPDGGGGDASSVDGLVDAPATDGGGPDSPASDGRLDAADDLADSAAPEDASADAVAGDATGLFLGCDPAHPTTPDGSATMCGASQTCQVNCITMRNECTAGGTGAPGTVCQNNLDCQPGTQCFDYSGSGCGVKVCLRFCDTNNQCSSFGASGSGSVGSVCEGRVACSATMDTAYHTCTFNCDPTFGAVPSHGGCPGALTCVMSADTDQVDCDCPAGRSLQEGESCATGSCAPGLICNKMNGTSICRTICPCDKNGSSCSAVNRCGTGKSCTAVANHTVYGVCL